MSTEKKTRSEQKREDILRAAMCAFREQGVQATSMDKLAEMANVSKRTVYNHFDSKETLVFCLLQEMWEQFMLRLDVRYQPNACLESQLRQLIEGEVAMMCDDDFVTLARLAMGHFFYCPEKMRAQLDKMRAQETGLERWLRDATADGRFAIVDIPFAADQIRSLLKGTLFWPRVMCDETCPEKVVQTHITEETLRMFLLRYQQ